MNNSVAYVYDAKLCWGSLSDEAPYQSQNQIRTKRASPIVARVSNHSYGTVVTGAPGTKSVLHNQTPHPGGSFSVAALCIGTCLSKSATMARSLDSHKRWMFFLFENLIFVGERPRNGRGVRPTEHRTRNKSTDSAQPMQNTTSGDVAVLRPGKEHYRNVFPAC